jgi:hypothetical protein
MLVSGSHLVQARLSGLFIACLNGLSYQRVVRLVVVEEVDVEDVVGVGHGSLAVWKTMPQPPYGHSALQGCRSVAVGTAAGQLQGFWIVVTN